MAKSATSASTLERVIRDLQRQRDKHVSAIADIDAGFKAYGIKTNKARKGSGKKAPAKKKRGRFNKTADQFITDLLKKNKRLSTREINIRWSRVGRGGSADNTLLNLVNNKTVKREKIKGGRGSTYQLR